MSSQQYQVFLRIEYREVFNSDDTKSYKWVLSVSNDGVYFDVVHAFKHFRHAKARLLKMAAEYESYTYFVYDGYQITEQVRFPEPVKESVSEETANKQYQFVSYRIEKQENGYLVLCLTFVSDKPTLFSTRTQSFKEELGVFEYKYLAIDCIKAHAKDFPAYEILHCGYKKEQLHIYDREQFFAAGVTELLFEVNAAAVGNGKSVADVANGSSETVSPPSNTGGLEQKSVVPTEPTKKAEEPSAFANEPPYSVFGDIEAELAKLQISEQYAQQVMEHGQLKTIMLRRGLNSPAFIDTISFTVHQDYYRNYFDDNEATENEIVLKSIVDVSECMGFKPVRETKGKNGYDNGLEFGDKEHENRNFGFVCWGGDTQNGSIMFHFTGEGLTYARQDWEKLLFLLFKKWGGFLKITRVDISHDFLRGEYQIEQAVEAWQTDKFTVRNTKPQAEMQGVDWLSGTKKGRTFYIGSKKSSRILYFYEKGKQLGDEESQWLRLELRQRNKDYIIPIDVLLYAGDYLCTAYPYLQEILAYDSSEQHRFERVKKTNGVAIEHVVKYAKMQVSPAIKMLRQFGLDDETIVDKLFNQKAKLPKRLVLVNPDKYED